MLSSIFSPPGRPVFDSFKFYWGIQPVRMILSSLFFLWSSSLIASNAVALPGDSTLVANICADEFYVFNGDTLAQPGTYTATYVASDGSDSTVTLLLNVFPQYNDSLSASICAGSFYEFYGAELTDPGVYSVVLTSTAGCDSIITLSLSVLPAYQTFTEAGICSGSSYFFHGNTLTTTGTYEAVLAAENGCDSLIVLDLQVVDYFEIELNERICSGGSYLFGDTLLTQSGIYVDSLIATGGCDSVVTLQLQVLPPVSVHLFAGVCTGYSYIFRGDTLTHPGDYVYQTTSGCDSIITLTLQVGDYLETNLAAAICPGETYLFNGQLLNTEGIYTDTLQANGGCDSVLILNLSILPALTTEFNISICPGESFFFEGVELADPGVYTSVYTGENGCDSTIILNLSYYPADSDTVTAVICEGGSYELYGQIFSQTGIYSFNYATQYGCEDTVTLVLTVRQPSVSEVSVTICQGELFFYDGQVLSQSGDYNFLLEDFYGCDSLVTLHLDVRPISQTNVNVDICQGELYSLGGVDYAAPGVYLIDLVSSYGCDSLIILKLTVLPDIRRILQERICHGETYEFEGQVLTSDGTYTVTYQASNGCDSIITLFLTVLPSYQVDLDAAICQGESYLFEGDTISQAGFYSRKYQALNGCDSVITLTLAVLPEAGSSASATICEGDSYLFNNSGLTTAGTYTAVLTAQNGCDSVVTLVLNVLPVAKTDIAATICASEGYPFAGQLLSQSGVYTLKLQSENGCDSVITLNLAVLPVYNSQLEASICTGESYWFIDTFLTISGTYQVAYQSQSGCDSTITLKLNVLPEVSETLHVSTCSGESYIYAGDTLTQSGDYAYSFPNGAVSGCDSLFIVSLTVFPPASSSISAIICEGESYFFNGAVLTASGTYTAVLTGQNGCDSVVTVVLNVLPVSGTDIVATVCASEGYPFGGQLLSQSGVYNLNLQSENGCDSVISLHLTVLPVYNSQLEASICSGESYWFVDTFLTVSGTYQISYQSQSGCDSTITLKLNVLPEVSETLHVSTCNGESYIYAGDTLTQSGDYIFIFPNGALNGCDLSVLLHLTVNPVILPTEIVGAICEGDSLTVGGEIFTDPGTYTISYTTPAGCDSVLIVKLAVIPAASGSVAVTLCPGDSIAYGGQVIGDPGVYTFHFTSAFGCDSVVTLSVNLVNPPVILVTLSGGTLTASGGQGPYQWINCATGGLIPGATGSIFTPAQSGSYAAVSTSSNGCTSVSNCVNVIISDTEDPSRPENWSLSPNPTSGFAVVRWSEATREESRLEVTDMGGRMIYSQKIPAGSDQMAFDLSDYPSGIYNVRVISGAGVFAKKLVRSRK